MNTLLSYHCKCLGGKELWRLKSSLRLEENSNELNNLRAESQWPNKENKPDKKANHSHTFGSKIILFTELWTSLP